MLYLPALAERSNRELPLKLEDLVAQGESALKTAEDVVEKADGDNVKGIEIEGIDTLETAVQERG